MYYRLIFAVLLVCITMGSASAQIDTLKAGADTLKVTVDDTISAPPAAEKQDTLPVVQAETVKDSIEPSQGKKHKEKYDKFKIGAGVSVGAISTDTRSYDSEGRVGYLISASYQRGRFFYWELGVDYNSTRIELTDIDPGGSETQSEFSVSSIDVPVSLGINILSVTDRIVGLRAFVGATPSFLLDVGNNDLGISKGNANSFNAYGHAGLSVNVLFIYVEAIYKYGFTDFFEDLESKPKQFQVKLGFRF